MKYFKSKDYVLAALASMADGNHAKAGAFLLKASQDPEFEQMVEQMDQEQADAMEEQQQQQQQQQAKTKVKPATALASIIEGMADVNDIEDLMDDLDHQPDTEIKEPEEVSIDGPDASGDVDVDVDDEIVETAASERVMSAAAERLARAQRNANRRK